MVGSSVGFQNHRLVTFLRLGPCPIALRRKSCMSHSYLERLDERDTTPPLSDRHPLPSASGPRASQTTTWKASYRRREMTGNVEAKEGTLFAAHYSSLSSLAFFFPFPSLCLLRDTFFGSSLTVVSYTCVHYMQGS